MMFLSGVSGLGAFDADYVREQMRLRSQGQNFAIQKGVATAEGLQSDSRIVWAREEAQRVAIRERVAAQVAEAEAARKKSTMLLAGGAVAAILAFVALKG